MKVTATLDTINRTATPLYGRSWAALYMATEIRARELDGTGVTVNIVNAGEGAHTRERVTEMRARSAAGKAEPNDMVAPLLSVTSPSAVRANVFSLIRTAGATAEILRR